MRQSLVTTGASVRNHVSFEPEKFFIGLLDFFSILLPGAVLTFFLKHEMETGVWNVHVFDNMTGAEGAAAFLVASYLLGHFVFLLGSWLDELYDVARRYTLNTQIEMLSRRGVLLAWPARAAIWVIFKDERNLAVNCARDLRNKQLSSVGATAAVNTFQWSKAWLAENKPKSLAIVQRFEADSKFFRCFVVVLLIAIGTRGALRQWHLIGFATGLLPLAGWRYMEQRFKATNQAYWSVLTAFAADPDLRGRVDAASRAATRKPDTPTHAGGIVFREHDGKIEFLLVEASKDPGQWVLPKGHIEKGEQPRDTAVREVLEETGVWARIHGNEPLGIISFKEESGAEVTVEFFVMEWVGKGMKTDAFRMHEWVTLETAVARLERFPETRELVQKAGASAVRHGAGLASAPHPSRHRNA